MPIKIIYINQYSEKGGRVDKDFSEENKEESFWCNDDKAITDKDSDTSKTVDETITEEVTAKTERDNKVIIEEDTSDEESAKVVIIAQEG